MKRNIQEYHKSIGAELQVLKDRVRSLIGDAHWLSDGEHKEAVLRRVISNNAPSIFRIGSGFISYPEDLSGFTNNDTSSQVDILISDNRKPTLFREGGIVIVTPDVVRAIIEVKTKVTIGELEEKLRKIGEEKQKIAESLSGNIEDAVPNIETALFCFEEPDSMPSDQEILKRLQSASNGQESRAVDMVVYGPNKFFRFWERGDQIESMFNGPCWHAYNLEGLAAAYFLGNIVHRLSPINPRIEGNWFSIENGKEFYRTHAIGLDNSISQNFN